MTIIDAQLHEPAVAGDLEGLDRDTRYRLMLEVELGYMDAVGVDKAVLFPIDDDWGLWARAQAPDRFAVVSMVTPPAVPGGIRADDPGLAELVARRAAAGEVVAMRAMHTLPGHLLNDRPDDGPVWTSDIVMYEPLMEACIAAGLPLFMSTAGALGGPAEVARRHPDLVVIVDHLGMRQNPTFGLDDPPFRDLPALLALAELPNVRVKVSGVPTLSAGPTRSRTSGRASTRSWRRSVPSASCGARTSHASWAAPGRSGSRPRAASTRSTRTPRRSSTSSTPTG